MIDYALYTIWIAFPVFFFGLVLWNKLEEASGKMHGGETKDFFSQGVFVSVCVIITILIDRFLLEDLTSLVPRDILPLGFFRVILLPFIFLIAAKVTGPSSEIRILRAPKPVENRKKRKR